MIIVGNMLPRTISAGWHSIRQYRYWKYIQNTFSRGKYIIIIQLFSIRAGYTFGYDFFNAVNLGINAFSVILQDPE